jgi:hypothetical protein
MARGSLTPLSVILLAKDHAPMAKADLAKRYLEFDVSR